MKHILLFTFLLSIATTSAQSSWRPVSSFPGQPRAWATGFSIGDKGYVGTGGTNGTYNNDIWEYDSINDFWSQKADLGGSLRSRCVAFSLNGKGYIGLGRNSSQLYNDVWRYDPEINSWSFDSFLPGDPLSDPVSFSIGNKAYVGTGSTKPEIGNETNVFFEYNPDNSSWTKKADVPGSTRTRAVAFSIDNRGYIAVGRSYNPSTSLKDLWQYNPNKDEWVQKADYPGSGSTDCIGFALNDYGYIGMGYQTYTDMWRYDPGQDTWNQTDTFWGSGRIASTSLAIANKGYMGLGYTTNAQGSVDFTDFWKFEDMTLSSTSFDGESITVNIFPNPSSDYVNILLNQEINMAEISIYDLGGRLWKELEYTTYEKIDISALKSGLYILKIKTDSGGLSKSFVKK